MMGHKKRHMGYEEDGYYIRVIQSINYNESVQTQAYNEVLDEMTAWCALSGGNIYNRNTFRFEKEEEATLFILRFNSE
jgi:CTP:phosphocholine cytidylyltransferase-like protein